MARTYDSQRLRHQRAMDRRLIAEHRQLAQDVAGVVLRAAAPDGTLPNRRTARSALSEAIWAQVLKPYYVGPGTDALQGDMPRSPFARLIYDGVAGVIRLAAERQTALLRRVVRDEAVLQWLTGPRPLGAVSEIRGAYDPWHRWVDPNGYRLADRIWRTGIDVRSRVDALLDYHIARGTQATDIAQELEQFLTPSARGPRTLRPYGREGSYAARRLARTEITAAAGRGTINASMANPFVESVQWRLSNGHPRIDICDEYARGGPNGDGVYPLDQVPTYPAHPHCLCNLLPVPAGNMADLIAGLRADIADASPRARAVQGLFNPSFLVGALLTGTLTDLLEGFFA